MELCSNMENKPLITFAGDLQVFQSVLPSLQKGIGSEAVEWKRAYGRTTKHVHLHPKFIPFDTESSSSSTSCANGDNATEQPLLTSLLDQSMLHTFWTDCPDVDVYRSTTKDLIQSWLNNVKNCNVREWLIILVEIPDNKKTKQLLPRTSVLDKIKNDFAQKQTERCICLADPTKFDSKSTESLHSMLHRLRQLLLASYSKTLTKFEENMRAQREKRNESGWNFCHYFLLQEELAFVLEMLEVYDEALVQYDELDALFTQFVLNSHLTDTPQWLLSFQRYGDRWPALNLSPSSSNAILSHIRETIKNSTVSLLNFRNYLFARQAGLLVKQIRVNELAQRSLGFLHNCINELNILDVAFSEDGAISCWVFVSCLEILATICGHGHGSPPSNKSAGDSNKNGDNINNAATIQSSNENANKSRFQHNNSNKNNEPQHQNVHHSSMQATDFSVHTASLWDYAREKLYDLGKLGGLLPKSQPKSDHLHKVVSLAAGLMCVDLPIAEISVVTVNGKTESQLINHQIPETPTETPITKLKNALSSKEQFEQHYLELCELAMGTYKHIGRIRSARKVGLGLASYYMEAEEYTKAIGFLTDALKTFRDDKWNLLVVDVLLKLAQCYQTIDDYDKYVRTCAQLACCKTLHEERRNHFFDEMISCLSKAENSDRHILSSLEDTFSINLTKIETPGKINRNSCPVSISIDVNSNLPKSVLSSSIQLAILVCDGDHEKHLSFQTSQTSTLSQSPGQIDIGGGGGGGKSRGGHQNNNNSGGGGGIVKRSSFESKGGRDKLAKRESINLNPLTCQDEDINISLQDVNHAMLRLDMSQHLDVKQDKSVHGGRLLCHNSHQALRRKDSQMKSSDVLILKADFSLVAKSNDIILNPGANSITLNAQVTKSGVYRIGQVSLQIKQFELLSPRLGCRFKFAVEKISGRVEIGSGNENLNLIAGIEQVISLNLHTGSNNISPGMVLHVSRSSLGLLLKVSRDSSFSTDISLPLPEAEPFSSVTIHFIVKAEFGPQKDNSVIEHKLMTRCPWSNDETKIPIIFIPPFMSSHRLNTVAQRKFIQVMLHGLSTTFTLSSHQLVVQHQNANDTPLVPLNPRSQQLALRNGQTTSYMWEIDKEFGEKMTDAILYIEENSVHQQAWEEHKRPLFSLTNGILNIVGSTKDSSGTQELTDDENPLRLEFSITFQTSDSHLQQLDNVKTTEDVKNSSSSVDERKEEDGTSSELYKYYICLQRFKTQFQITSRVEPHKGIEFCRVGNMCSMIIDIFKYDNPGQTSLINFNLSADQHMWAICGRTSGVVSMEESNSQQIIIDVMPMSPGFLPLPTVHLSKYIPADQKGGNSSVPFNSGQVFNQSRGAQMHVLPPPQTPAQSMSSCSGSNVTPGPGPVAVDHGHY